MNDVIKALKFLAWAVFGLACICTGLMGVAILILAFVGRVVWYIMFAPPKELNIR